MTAFMLAHLSDPHLPPMPRPRPRELAGKRALGYLNWMRHRRLSIAPKCWTRSSPTCRRRRPTTSRSPAISSISRWRTNSAARAGSPARPARPSRRAGQPRRLCAASPATLCGNFRRYYRGDDPPAPGVFPFLRRRGPLALIGVSTRCPRAADGDRLARARRSSTRSNACSPGWREALFRVLLIHHPLRSQAQL